MFDIQAQARRVKRVMRKSGLSVIIKKSATTSSVYVFGRRRKITVVVRVSDHPAGMKNTHKFNVSIHPGWKTIDSVNRFMKKIAYPKPKPKKRKR